MQTQSIYGAQNKIVLYFRWPKSKHKKKKKEKKKWPKEKKGGKKVRIFTGGTERKSKKKGGKKLSGFAGGRKGGEVGFLVFAAAGL